MYSSALCHSWLTSRVLKNRFLLSLFARDSRGATRITVLKAFYDSSVNNWNLFDCRKQTIYLENYTIIYICILHDVRRYSVQHSTSHWRVSKLNSMKIYCILYTWIKLCGECGVNADWITVVNCRQCVGKLVLEVKLFISDHFDIEMRRSYGLLSLSTIILFTAS